MQSLRLSKDTRIQLLTGYAANSAVVSAMMELVSMQSKLITIARQYWIQRITFAAETNAACSRYVI